MLYGKENALNLYRFFGDVGGAKRNYDGGKFKYRENKYGIKVRLYVVWEPESNSLER